MTDDPVDPSLDPERSPGRHTPPTPIEDIDVGRDVDLGTATPRELTVSDTEPLADASVDELAALLDVSDRVERARAALSLAERDDAPVDALVAAVRTDPDPEVRQFAVEALAGIDDPEAGNAALDALDDETPWVRAEAIVTLDALDRDTHADAIESVLTDPHHAVRRNAAVSLYKRDREAARDVLLEQLSDPSPRVREWAAHFLAAYDDDRVSDALTALSRDDENDLVRRTATHALDGLSPRDVDARDAVDRLNRRPDL